MSGSTRSSGEGRGNPPKYPCLENPMDKGAQCTTVHGLEKSKTQLSDEHVLKLQDLVDFTLGSEKPSATV